MENIKCPITKNKFYEPYVLSSGYTFEETVINNNSLSRCPLTHIEFKFTTDPTIDGRNYNNKIIQKPIPNILLSKCMMHINETYSNFSDNLLKCPITGKIFTAFRILNARKYYFLYILVVFLLLEVFLFDFNFSISYACKK